MKTSAHVHHKSVKEIKRKGVDNNYSIKYVASPKKAYLVNPVEGEINYEKAKKNYNKFYDEVSKQKVVKYGM